MVGLFRLQSSQSVELRDMFVAIEGQSLTGNKNREIGGPQKGTRYIVILQTSPEDGKQLIEKQRIVLPEKSAYVASSILLLPSGNVICSLAGVSKLFEFQLRNTTTDKDPGPLMPVPKIYEMPQEIRALCELDKGGAGFQSDFVFAASFFDKTLRVFKFSGGRFEELYQLSPSSDTIINENQFSPLLNREPTWNPFWIIRHPSQPLLFAMSIENKAKLLNSDSSKEREESPAKPVESNKLLIAETSSIRSNDGSERSASIKPPEKSLISKENQSKENLSKNVTVSLELFSLEIPRSGSTSGISLKDARYVHAGTLIKHLAGLHFAAGSGFVDLHLTEDYLLILVEHKSSSLLFYSFA